jgi:hypothetical protein
MHPWWILVIEGWYDPEEARNETYKKFSRLQVSAQLSVLCRSPQQGAADDKPLWTTLRIGP